MPLWGLASQKSACQARRLETEGKVDDAGEERIITGAKSLRGTGSQGPSGGAGLAVRTRGSSSESG